MGMPFPDLCSVCPWWQFDQTCCNCPRDDGRQRIADLEAHLRDVLDEVRDCELTGAGYLSLQRACAGIRRDFCCNMHGSVAETFEETYGFDPWETVPDDDSEEE